MALSHHGEYVGYNHTNEDLLFLEVATGDKVKNFKTQGKVLSAIWSRDNRYVITGGYDQTLQIWEWETKTCTRILKGHRGFITKLVTTRFDKYLISGSDDRTIRIWDFKEGKHLHTCGEHLGWISCCELSKDQKYV